MVPPLPSRLQPSFHYNLDPVSPINPLGRPFSYNGMSSRLTSLSLAQPTSRSGLSSLATLGTPSSLQIEKEFLLARVRALNRELASSSAAYSSLSSLSSSLSTNISIPANRYHAAPSAHMLALAKEKSLLGRDLREEQHALNKSMNRKPSPEEAWDTMFKALLHYRLKRGDCLVKEKDDPKLGRWVRNQRNRKKQGRLTQDRVNRLESIGFVWCMVQQESWDVMFSRLAAYKEKHGNCLVPRTYKEDPKLGRWVDTQRNKNRDDMSEERMQQLKDIGFVWQVHKQSWDSMFERLRLFKEENGNCLVPSVYRKDPKLGTWVHVQRARRVMLSKDRKRRLDSIGFVWCMFQQKGK